MLFNTYLIGTYMGNFIDHLPFDWTNSASQELLELLSQNYYQEKEAINIIRQAGIDPSYINFSSSPRSMWHDIIEISSRMGKLRDLISATTMDSKASGIQLRLTELLSPTPVVEAPFTGGISWRSENRRLIERTLGAKSTWLDVSFLEIALKKSPAVARVLSWFGTAKYYGNGFLVGRDTLLTNHHVLFNWKQNDTLASKVEIQFNYQFGANNQLQQTNNYEGEPSSIKGVREHDWAIIKLREPLPASYPTLSLGLSNPQQDDRVYIIQHTNGGPKQIGLHRNIIRYVDNNIIHYLTETAPGSSGSPIFNEKWEVIALHHCWTKSIDSETNATEYRNEGINIKQIIDEIGKLGISL